MIIGIGHKARNGKTTIAEYLQLKYNFKTLNFADALYEECRNANSYLDVDEKNGVLVPISVEDCCSVEKILGTRSIPIPTSLMPYINVVREGMVEKCAPLLQWWGTDFRRTYFGRDYWTSQIVQVIKQDFLNSSRYGSHTDWAIGDMRFINEAKVIKELGGETWKVDRQYIDPSRDPNHPSEIDLDYWKFDRVLMNTGTKGDLFRMVDANMKRMGGIYEELS